MNSMLDSYRGQIRQAANRQRSGQQVDEDVSLKIDKLRGRLADNSRSQDGLKVREQEIRAQFGKQLDRYRFLEEEWAEESTEG
jgi:hypothetical protein